MTRPNGAESAKQTGRRSTVFFIDPGARCGRSSTIEQNGELNLKIFSWNVNGIRAVLKKNVFYPFLEKHQPGFCACRRLRRSVVKWRSIADYKAFGIRCEEGLFRHCDIFKAGTA
jgi:hypothetical protein